MVAGSARLYPRFYSVAYRLLRFSPADIPREAHRGQAEEDEADGLRQDRADGDTTANYIDYPERFRSKTTKYEFSVEKAAALLEKAGCKKGADGFREKDGRKLKLGFQTSINQPRQKTQAIVKQADQAAIPVVSRPDVAAVKDKLVVDLSGWDSNTWDLPNWYLES